mmetsp:Transcript_10556/g.42670  ORF Transcript_10556/g.42670 Transcript_10556/m.42670 type:complete len:232 (-) Transcript_10556:392-1087(-)
MKARPWGGLRRARMRLRQRKMVWRSMWTMTSKQTTRSKAARAESGYERATSSEKSSPGLASPSPVTWWYSTTPKDGGIAVGAVLLGGPQLWVAASTAARARSSILADTSKSASAPTARARRTATRPPPEPISAARDARVTCGSIHSSTTRAVCSAGAHSSPRVRTIRRSAGTPAAAASSSFFGRPRWWWWCCSWRRRAAAGGGTGTRGRASRRSGRTRAPARPRASRSRRR